MISATSQRILRCTLIALALGPQIAFGASNREVEVPPGIDHSIFDHLLSKYVSPSGLVDYAGWKADTTDFAMLNRYIRSYANPEGPRLNGPERAAALINLYNAGTIRWILRHYPTESIRKLKNSWSERRYNVGGTFCSLDDIEHANLRPQIGWRVHAIVVCAARSCPPLRRYAVTPERLDEQIDEAFRAWLGRSDLNHFSHQKRRAELSAIFRWYRSDFEAAGGIREVLMPYVPDRHRDLLDDPGLTIEFLDYDWALNSQAK